MGTIVSTYHGDGTVWQFGSNGKGFNYFDGVGAESLPLEEGDMDKWMLVTLRRTRDTVLELFTEGRLDMRIPVHDNQPSPNALKIGYNGRGGGMAGDSIPEVLNGEIAAILLYDRALDDEELDRLHKQLAREYGFPLRAKPFRETPWFYVMLFLLFVSTAVAVWKILDQRKLKRQMALLQRQHEIDLERQRISREMHDDIGAGLTQIILMSESARRKLGGDSEKEIEDIAGTSRRLVGSMNEIIWSLNPENKTLAQLFSYLREQLHRQLEYAGMDYSIEFPEGGEEVVLRNEQRRNLLLVTREIVNNAIKYSGAGRLRIRAERNDNGIVFEIGDDGRGFDPAAMRSGNGLKNIRHRIEELNGTLELDTAPGKGCRYRFWIPF